MTKIGLVRCEMAARSCPGTACFKVIKTKTGTFEEFKSDDIDIIGMITCGGCPGRDAIRQVQEMVKRGAEVIFMCTCLIKPIPNPPKCPYAEELADAIRDKLGVRVIMGTH
ncbi:MAG: CGGC domain-containing protein [Methanosarcinales archaeon]|jgi:predicted metal-binding protein|nr:CGGC domain-containing protein [Methanosarcinales archaeon]NOR59915.1 CGGC domain-containing protein [Methanosarcinales archaeon]